MCALTRNRFVLFPVALVAMAFPLAGQAAPDDDSYQGEGADRYAMVRVLDGDVTIRKGEVEEALTRGTPVAEGDVLESRGRGVLQLADGTRIAFDGATRFQVSALFQDRDGGHQVLLRLDYGRLRLTLGGEARIRVDTPSGTAALKDRAQATLDARRDRTVRLGVSSGRSTFSNNRDEVSLSAGERITVYSSEDRLDRVRTFNTFDQDGFEAWADGTVPSRRGESYQRVPQEIRHYADDLDGNGDWVEVEDVGWCWRPRVSVEWRPFWRGRWGAYSGGLTWVSDDPFGYVTSHFGRWGWSLNWGWHWIPGVHYSPAWVAWNWTGEYCGWAPLNYWNSPTSWGYGAWGGGHCWNVVSIRDFHQSHIDHHIHSDVNVLRTFGGNRDLRASWTRGPVVVTQTEFRNPAQLTRAFDSGVRRDRLRAYEHQAQSTTGRIVVRRDAAPASPSGAGARDQRIPFEDRSRYQVRTDPRRDATPRERSFEPRPSTTREEHRPAPPRERAPESRPLQPREERRTEPPKDRPRERSFESRPSTGEERRREAPAESPRVRAFEPRPSESRQERRVEQPRERTPEPRQERRSEAPRERPAEVRVPVAPRQEHRVDPPKESRPASPSGSDKPSGRKEDRR